MNSKAESAMEGGGEAETEETSVIDPRVGDDDGVGTGVNSEWLATEADGRMETG